MMHRLVWALVLGGGLVSLGLAAGVDPVAAPLRDPTLPPASVRQNDPATRPDGSPAPEAELAGMAILVRDGKPYVMAGSRLYAQGQKIGQSRIERISETEVWFRDASGLRKWSPFSGIERRTVADPATPCEPSANQKNQKRPSPKTTPARPGASTVSQPVPSCATVPP